MTKIKGSFYFKQTKNNNLIGEFTNNSLNRNHTESADITTNYEAPFIGTFISTYHADNTSFLLSLIISYKPNSNNKIYDLKWLKGNNNEFEGQGFLVDDILIGDYRSS